MKLVNQQLIKNNNLKLIYSYIHQEQGISRTQLAKLSQLSKTTVSSLVDELIERNFIYDSGTADSSAVGRKPNSLQLKSGQLYVAVICWSENDIHAQVVDICGSTVFEGHRPLGSLSYAEESKDLFFNTILKDIPREQVLGIVIVVPAMIDIDRQEIFATTLAPSALSGSNTVKELRSIFTGFPVALLNDSACTAYAEKVYARISEKDFVFINFNKGIGATLFIQDTMLGKATASYTQFGHYSVNPNGKTCTCGNKGCLELTIGECSLPERLKAMSCTSSLSSLPEITYGDLGLAATYGDLAAQKIIQDIVAEFSQALINLVCLVHPKLVIIGGRGKDLGPVFLEELQKTLKVKGFRRMMDSLQVRYGMLDSNACFKGAMKYFFDIHYDFTQDISGEFFIG